MQAHVDALITGKTRPPLVGIPLALSFVIIVAAFAAYSSTLFNFFCGDDYIHVEWLARAVHDPSLIWRNFYGSWLDDRCALYYRPFVSLSFVTDYVLWGENGLGFRITNILLLLAAGSMLFMIIKDLPRQLEEESQGDIEWAVLASFLFVLYPLHPEAVVWITGRVDCLVAPFYLASVWCYIRYRRSAHRLWLGGAAAMMICALCTKEMGISLPLAFVAFEIIYARQKDNRFTGKGLVIANVCFFALLGLYFYMRSIFLGSAVGGWNNALAVDWHTISKTWAEGLRKMILPFNDDAMHPYRSWMYRWDLIVLAASVCSLFRLAVDKRRRRDACFFLLLFGACMLPVYKVFNISGDLESSRYAYLGTAPLCALLTSWFGIDQTSDLFSARIRACAKYVSLLVAALFLALSAFILRINCNPWRTAGQEANAVSAGIHQIAAENAQNKPIVLLEYPDNFEGAYICRNAIVGLQGSAKLNLWTTPPLPFGLLKDQLKTSDNAISVYKWQPTSMAFKQVNSNLLNEPASDKIWQGEDLKKILTFDQSPGVRWTWQSDQSLKIESNDASPIFHLDFSQINPGTIEFIAFDFQKPNRTGDLSSTDLHFVSDSCSNGNIHPVTVSLGAQRLWVFPLRGIMEWAFSHKIAKLDVTLPGHSNLVLNAVLALKPAQIAPVVTIGVDMQTLFNANGVLRVSDSSPAIPLTFNAAKVAGAEQLQVDISKPNYMFVHANLPETSPALILKTLKVPINHLNLPVDANLFPAKGFYQIRVTAFDADDNAIGLPSDHVVFLKQ